MRSSADILVLGSCIQDVSVAVPTLPVDGQTLVARDIRFGLGGKGANQAVACARLGVATALITALGRDHAGREFRKMLGREGLLLEGVSDCDLPTGIGVPIITDGGGKAIIVMAGASMALSSKDVLSALLAHPRTMFGLAQLETSSEALETFVGEMIRRRARLIVNAAPCLPGRAHLLEAADWIVVNREEAEWLSGKAVEGISDALLVGRSIRAAFSADVVVTLGAQGAVVADADGEAHLPARQAAVVDRTGAGDAFCAALAMGLQTGRGIHRSASFASFYASLACERAGAIDGMPHAAEIPYDL